MSTTIDERVVSMQFDNKRFESNVHTSMSTLDKLKQKLNLSGASKGLENVSAAAKKVDMASMGSAVETVRAKFSALDVVGVTALANIANSAVNAGKRILSALTIDPVTTGFSEYEMKMDSVKTIMASTGESVETVNKYLEELNEYSDQTIYSFSDMTQNIGKFTNAGVKLEDAVMAIKGISNEAAVSGANANEASRAMYNFAQALSAGYVKLIDWKSIENANMATVEFKQQLIDAAVAAGTLEKQSDGMYKVLSTNMQGGTMDQTISATKNFNDSLNYQWMTTEVLVNTLKDYADNTTEIGKKAFAAAQDVTKLSQMFDVLKETAQSGWARTWEIIFGDINQAKALFTPLTNFFSKIIDGMSDFRNNILKGALGNPWETLIGKIDDSGLGTIKKYVDAAGAYADKLQYYQDVVNKVWRGDYNNAGDNPDRYDLLEKAGYNHKVVQSLVNKGYKYKLTVDDIKKAHEQFGVSLDDSTKATESYTGALEDLTDEQLKNLGFTDEEIRMFRALAKEAKKSGKSLKELIDEMSKADGRTLLFGAFENLGKSLIKVFKSVSSAWKEVFPPKSIEERSLQLYNLISAFNKFSSKLIMSDKTADKLKRTFKGLFALIDIITTVVAGPIKLAFKALAKVLGLVDIDILSVTASIGDAIVAIRDWIDAHNPFVKGFEILIPILKKAGGAIKDWIDGLKETDNIPKYIISGLVNGLVNGVKTVITVAREIGTKILETVKKVLGIHSPSVEFFKIGQYIIEGLVNGLKWGATWVWDMITTIGTKALEMIKSLDLGTVLATAISAGVLITALKFIGVLGKFADALKGFSNMADGIGEFFKDFGQGVEKWLKAAALEKKSKAVLRFAIAIGILAAAVTVLTLLPAGDMWSSVGAIAALAGVMIILAKVVGGSTKQIADFNIQAISILAIAASLLLVAIALKQLSSINIDKVIPTLTLLGGVVAALVGVTYAFGKLSKPETAAYMDKAGIMLVKMSVALLIMTFVIKQIGKLDDDAIGKGLAVITGLGALCIAMAAVSKLAGEHASKAGGMLLKMSIALGIMVAVIKQAAKLDSATVERGIGVIALVEILFIAVVAVSKLAGEHASKAGTMMLKMAVAIGIMTASIKLIAYLDDAEVQRGIKIIAVIESLFVAIIAVSKLAGENASKAGTMLLAMSGAILVLTGCIFVLSLLKPDGLARATAAIVVLEGCLIGLIAVTKIAKGTEGMDKVLMKMVIAISILSVAIVALSLLDPTRVAVAAGAISAVVGVFTGLIAVTKLAKNSKQMNKTLLIMTGVVAILGGLIAGLSLLKPEAVLASSGALSLLLTSFSVSMVILGKTGRISTTVVPTLVPMMLVMAGLTALLAGLSLLKPEAVLASAASLSTTLIAFSAAIVILSKVGAGASAAMSAIPALLALMGAITAVVAIAGGLNMIPGIQEFMNGGSELLNIIGNAIGSFIGSIISGFGTAATAGLPEIGQNLSAFMTNLQPFIAGLKQIDLNMAASVAALSAAIVALTAAEVINGLVMFFSGGNLSLAQLGADLSGFMIAAMPFIAGIKTLDPSTVEATNSLVGIILAITAAQVINGIASFLTGGSSMATFGQELVSFGKSIAEFSDTVKGRVDESAVLAAANAGKAMAEMAKTIPNSGGVVGFFMGENDMDTFGSQLESFGKSIAAFSATVAGKVNEDAVIAAANAGKAMAEMATTIPNSGGVVGFFAGENDMDVFGTQLESFGKSIAAFSATVAGQIDEDAVVAAANAGKMMAEMAATIPNTGGVVSWFTGDNDMATFGQQLVPFGTAIASFSGEVKGIDEDAVIAAANAGKMMAEMAKTIPNTGGVGSWFTGDNDMQTFGTQLKSFGTAMKNFSGEVKNIDESAVTAAACAGKMLAEMANKIPNSGGLGSLFTGDNDMKTFGSQLKSFGTALKSFASSVSGIDITALNNGVSAGDKVAAMIKKVPTSGGLWDLITNGLSMASLSTQLVAYGAALKLFAAEVANISLDAINIGSTAGSRVNSIIANMPKNAMTVLNGASAFKTDLTNYGGALAGFSTAVSSVSYDAVDIGTSAGGHVSSMLRGIKDFDLKSILSGAGAFKSDITNYGAALSSFADEIADINLDALRGGINGLKDAMKSLGEIGDSGVEEFTKAFENGTPKVSKSILDMLKSAIEAVESKQKMFRNVGKTMMLELSTGIKTDSSKVSDSMDKAISKLISNISNSSIRKAFHSAGGHLATGFANGISANSYKAVAKSKAMAAKALAAAKAELDINSPSKEAYKLGDFYGLGFINALSDYADKAYSASSDMAESAKLGLSNAISRIRDVIEGNVDTQPTIRPVLDLSAVSAGAGAINGMFNMSPSVGVLSNVRSISSMMNDRQNGGNDDIVSAIYDLKDSLGETSGPSYTINGITYDDGSNIAEAVSELTRAARLERRI